MPDAFGGIVESLDYPMVVVTATDGAARSGCLVGFQTQCSIEPRRWLLCISKKNHTFPVALAAEFLAVHILRYDQRALAELFGGEAYDTVDKFTRCPSHAGPRGTVILDGCDYFIGRIVERHDFGDHVGHLVDVVAAEIRHPGGRELGFQTVHGMKPGHAP